MLLEIKKKGTAVIKKLNRVDKAAIEWNGYLSSDYSVT